MHNNNYLTLSAWRCAYPEFFSFAKVLELGSLNVNGTVRVFFDSCDYIGIDKRKGRGVDLVVEANKSIFEKEYFDTIISFSMFEHDPTWKESIKNNLQWLKLDGMLFLSLGAEGNKAHYDGGHFVKIPHKEFVAYLEELGLTIVECFFEKERYRTGHGTLRNKRHGNGVFNVCAIKNNGN